MLKEPFVILFLSHDFVNLQKKILKKRFKIGDIDIITLLNSWI